MKARDRQWLGGQAYNFRVNKSLWSQMCPANEPASTHSRKQSTCCTRAFTQYNTQTEMHTLILERKRIHTHPKIHMKSNLAEDTHPHTHTTWVHSICSNDASRLVGPGFFSFHGISHVNPQLPFRKKTINFPLMLTTVCGWVSFMNVHSYCTACTYISPAFPSLIQAGVRSCIPA